MQAEHEFYVGLQDIGADDLMTDRAILEAMTNMVNHHASLVGEGLLDRPRIRRGWVVLGWMLEVYRRPRSGDTVRMRTWARDNTLLQGFRDVEMLNADGERLAAATSVWVVMNTDTWQMLRITPEIIDCYEPEPEHRLFPDYRFPKKERQIPPADAELDFRIPKCMIDCNHHVHNPSYLDLAAEVLPEGLDRRHFSRVEISYRHEIKPHELVHLVYVHEETCETVYLLDESRTVIHAVVRLGEAEARR
ncbi:MAG: hypothetical protein ILP12_02280 [Lachnospiraceae bacterium]|nr:hypothetical protein [Lachnospiraceae bacterium]